MACIICNSEREIKIFRYLSTDFFECVRCGLIRTFPFPTETQIRDHYQKKYNYGNYSTLLSHMESYSAIYENYVKLLQDRRGTLNGKKILDVGCFTGNFLDIAFKNGAITHGIELQKDAYDIAYKKHAKRILNCSFDNATFEEKFDIITLFGVIEHLTRPDVLLQKASEWLIEGGTIMIQTPNTGSLFAKTMRKYWPPYSPIEHIHYFSSDNLRLLLEKNGFTEVEIRPHRKQLTIGYVYDMLQNFGTEFRKVLAPFVMIMPESIKSRKWNFYVGEMMVMATKRHRRG